MKPKINMLDEIKGEEYFLFQKLFAQKLFATRVAKRKPIKTIIHVNQHAVKRNAKTGGDEPVLTVKTYKHNTYAHSVAIDGPSRVIYSPDKPLSCGARVWIETRAHVTIDPQGE
jgi:CO dehydrogenase/acetyl-CoA synthase beta subunit